MGRFSERLRILRTEKKLTQKKLGEALGVNPTTVTKWEQGKFEPPTEMLIKIADFFEVSTDYLVGNIDDPISFEDINKKLSRTQSIDEFDVVDLQKLRKALSEREITWGGDSLDSADQEMMRGVLIPLIDELIVKRKRHGK